MHFRTDINGLRAIAVIAVVLFHFNASCLPGGFAGVDVFFVIGLLRVVYKLSRLFK
jgi:peptidoglycan/LPS O-acetylase OafA/YrhL